jgi:hypothetical protein
MKTADARSAKAQRKWIQQKFSVVVGSSRVKIYADTNQGQTLSWKIANAYYTQTINPKIYRYSTVGEAAMLAKHAAR